MADTPEEGNGRISAAEKRAKWEERIERGQDEIKRMLADFCVASVEDRKDIHARIEKGAEDHDDLELKVTKIEERIGIFAGAQAIFTAVSVGISTAIMWLRGGSN